MDKEELLEKLGEPIARLLDARQETEDPTTSRDWELITAALEEDGELVFGEEADVEFPSFTLDALGEGRLNDEEMREELGLDEDDAITDEDRAEFVRSVLRDEVSSGEAGETDVHPRRRCPGIGPPGAREVLHPAGALWLALQAVCPPGEEVAR